MKKFLKNLVLGLCGACLAAVIVQPAVAAGLDNSFRELLTEEKAALGATHETVIRWPALTLTSTNITQTLTNGILPANAGIECVGGYLVTPFDTATTVTNDSLSFIVGVLSDTDKFMTGMQCALAGTEELFDYGTSTQLVNSVATNIIVTVTPNAHQPPNISTSGEVHFLWRIRRATDVSK